MTVVESAPVDDEGRQVERRHRRQAVIVLVGLGLLTLGILLLEGKRSQVPGWERQLFLDVNGWPNVLELPFKVEMQLGNFWSIAVVAVVLLAFRRSRAALSVVLAGLLAWAFAKVVKRLIERGRPFDLIPNVDVRESGITGLGFVSGHTATAFAIATALLPWLPPRWRWVPMILAAVVGLARIYVGAHLPLDVVGGAGLGVACGALSTWIVGHHRRAPATSPG